MRHAIIVTGLFLGAFFAPIAQAEPVEVDGARCADFPPCGPIPAIITIFMDKSKGLTFENNLFESDGRVQYYFDVDNDGYVYDPDPTQEVVIKMGVNKQPAWVKTTVEPAEMVVPVNDPRYIKEAGAPGQLEFVFEFPIHVTVEKLREPSYEELKKVTKSDGTYRIMINAYSNDSMAGHDTLGRPAGLQEGYGIKELRFISAEEQAFKDNAAAQPAGNAPGVGLLAFVAAMGATIVLLRRRT
ncbi:MAG TPA: hypothetical protein VGB18_03035 [Candidatus Thermoplasmatota archaeon]